MIMKRMSLALCAALLTLTLLLLAGCGGQHIPVSPDLGSDSVGSLPLSSETSSAEPPSSEPASSSVVSVSSAPSSAPSTNAAPSKPQTATSKKPATSSKKVTSSTPTKPNISTAGFHLKGLWISCFEMPFTKKDTAASAKAKVDAMMKTVAKQGYNAVFCHVRPFADAFYPSKYFPHSKYVSGTEGVDPGYDALQLMLDAAHQNGMQFHAWINPYRVSTSTTDPAKLSKNNIAATWATDGSNRAIVVKNKGIYFNPALQEVQQLVIKGVKEIINNYDVDGIHFDDYFYPTTAKSFDAATYLEYTTSAGANPLSLADWRRANVNALVSAVHRACKNKNVTFGISPAADIDKNRDGYYADVAMWMAKAGYIDYIMPQIYFGYEHPVLTARYSYLLNRWCGLTRHSNLQLYIGLGAYRMSEPSVDDYEEWSTDAELLAKQAKDAKTAGTGGIVIFSYAATTNQNEHHRLQIKNMFSAIK